MAPAQGFEPQSAESESAVLPLNEAGIGQGGVSRTRTPGFQGRATSAIFHPVIGARGRIRTPIFNSNYGSPVRSRRRLRAHGAASGFRSRFAWLRTMSPSH